MRLVRTRVPLAALLLLHLLVGCSSPPPQARTGDDAASRYTQPPDARVTIGEQDTTAVDATAIDPPTATVQAPDQGDHTAFVEMIERLNSRLDRMEESIARLNETVVSQSDDLAARLDAIVDRPSPDTPAPLAVPAAPPPSDPISPAAGNSKPPAPLTTPPAVSFRDEHKRLARDRRTIRSTIQHSARLNGPARLFGRALNLVADFDRLAKGSCFNAELVGTLDSPAVGERVGFLLDTQTSGSFTNPAENALALQDDLWAEAEICSVKDGVVALEIQFLVWPSPEESALEYAIPVRATLSPSPPASAEPSVAPQLLGNMVQGLAGDFNGSLTASALLEVTGAAAKALAEEKPVLTIVAAGTADGTRGVLWIVEDAEF
jgi:hypothetical protein